MDSTTALDLGSLVLRVGLGIVFFAHGWNHVFGGGKIAGTARWFASMGMRPPVLHAWLASLTELGAAVLALAGLATRLAAAGMVGVMVVAFVINHRKNGFFIFRPGEGYEYVMTLTFAALALASLGGGAWSLDAALGWEGWSGWSGLLTAAIAGAAGSCLLLAACWRPARSS